MQEPEQSLSEKENYKATEFVVLHPKVYSFVVHFVKRERKREIQKSQSFVSLSFKCESEKICFN